MSEEKEKELQESEETQGPLDDEPREEGEESQEDLLADLLEEDQQAEEAEQAEEEEQEASSEEETTDEEEEDEDGEGSNEREPEPPAADLPEDDPLAGLLDEEELPEVEDPDEAEEAEEELEEEEEEDDEEGEEKSAGSSRKELLLTVASILAVLILLGGGFMTLWYLWEHPPVPQGASMVSLTTPEPPQEEKASTETSTPLTSSPIAVEARKILFLKNFLIPYQRDTGEYIFVKAKVLLYYANERDYAIAKKNEPLLREHIYRLLKNVPLYVWESKKGEPLVRRELLSYLTKKEIGGVVPQDLEVTGYILK